jgi:hypothetical protein
MVLDLTEALNSDVAGGFAIKIERTPGMKTERRGRAE